MKIVTPSILRKISSTVGIFTLRRIKAVFAIRMSNTNLTSPVFVGMAIRRHSSTCRSCFGQYVWPVGQMQVGQFYQFQV